MHERIDIDRHEVILVEDQALNFIDQPVPLFWVDTGLMPFPALLDGRLADERGWAVADGIDPDTVLRATGPWADIHHDGAIALIAVATLAGLGAKHWPLQGLQLAPDANGAQISENA